jgi:hypothetical protein
MASAIGELIRNKVRASKLQHAPHPLWIFCDYFTGRNEMSEALCSFRRTYAVHVNIAVGVQVQTGIMFNMRLLVCYNRRCGFKNCDWHLVGVLVGSLIVLNFASVLVEVHRHVATSQSEFTNFEPHFCRALFRFSRIFYSSLSYN